jgi:hypothetical protein
MTESNSSGEQATKSANPETPAPAVQVAGWESFSERVRDRPGRMLDKLPLSMRMDGQVQQEVARLALAAITAAALDALACDGDHPAFVPQIGQVLNVGQPNADTIYRMARLTPGGSYRIRGFRGTLPICKIGQAPPSPAELAPGSAPQRGPRPHHDFNTLAIDAAGRYDVLLCPERPPGYGGDWWKLEPTTNKLLLRMVSSDWGKELDPTFAIERVDRAASRGRPSAAQLEERLRQIPRAAEFLGPMFVDHVEKLRREGYTNKFKVLDVSQIGGLAGQFYYEGPYELNDDEALIVETKMPAKCPYRSLILTNEIYETTDWYNNHSSLNGAQAQADADGVLRIVVSAKDPGIPNWLDTAGHPRGLIQGRWTDCDSQPIPMIRKVAFADVRAALPAGTPSISKEQRERVLRERRAAYQQRPLW